MIKICHKYQN